jgi:hypothetical protein
MIAALQMKTVSIRDRCWELQAEIDPVGCNVARARTAAEVSGTNESAEIQTELCLAIKANELRATAQRGQSDLVSFAGRAAKSKGLYLKNVATQRKMFKVNVHIRDTEVDKFDLVRIGDEDVRDPRVFNPAFGRTPGAPAWTSGRDRGKAGRKG